MRPVFTAVWFTRCEPPTETTWLTIVGALAFAQAIFQYRQILAVKVWQGINPEDPFCPEWIDDPLLVYKLKKPEAETYLFHLQNTST
jgi:hypothetical protein